MALPVRASSPHAKVSYNPGTASKFHAPISSVGLDALNHAPSVPAGASLTAPSQQSAPATPVTTPAGSIRFINDSSYFPQSETSVAVDPSNPNHVVGGYNDARYFFCASFPTSACPTGWTYSLSGFTTSANGGRSVDKSSDLPGVLVTENNLTSGTTYDGYLVPYGDPSVVAAPGGVFYYASLAVDPVSGANGVMLAESTSSLWNPTASCVTSQNTPWVNSCWTSTLIEGNMSFQCLPGYCFNTSFEDKELGAVDFASTSAYYGSIYVSWDHFYSSGLSSTYAARCNSQLTCVMLSGVSVTPLSGSDPFVAFSTPAVGPDGRVYVSWCNYGTFFTFGPVTCKVASSAPGGASFGTPSDIVSFMGAGTNFPSYTVLQGFATEQFRVSSVPSFASDGSNSNNLYFTIDACSSGSYYAFNLGYVTDNPGNCGDSAIIFAKSTNKGATWSTPQVISNNAVNFQPYVTVDPTSGRVVVVYYTTQYDPFNHRVDVVGAISNDGGSTFSTKRLTSVSDEINSDPAMYDYIVTSGFGGSFIVPQFGDYFQAVALSGNLYVLYTGNYVPEQGTFKASPFLATLPSAVPALVLGAPGSQSVATGDPLSQAAPGASVPYSASGFTPNTSYNLTLQWSGLPVLLATGTVSSAGVAQGTFTVPNIQSQVYTITAEDSAAVSASTSFGVGQVDLGPLQTSVNQLSASVSSGFSTLDSSISTLSSSLTSDTAAIQSSVSGVSSSLTSDTAAIQNSVSGISTSLSSKLSALGTQITTVQDSVSSDINSLSSQLTTVEYLVVVAVVLALIGIAFSFFATRKSKATS